VVCGDTGVAHLATAYRTPSVLLFGPMSPALWGPPLARPQHRVLWHGHLAGRGEDGPHPALLDIDVAEVLDAVGDIELQEIRRRSP
jgi:ADP-heptose:LPS heptosyltransferase